MRAWPRTSSTSDGTGAGSNSIGPSGLYNPLGTWAIGADGSETLTRYYCDNGSANVSTKTN